jgi:hypothetical protein
MPTAQRLRAEQGTGTDGRADDTRDQGRWDGGR